MTPDNNLSSEAVFLVDAPGSSPGYAYDACAPTIHLHTASDGSNPVLRGFSIERDRYGYSSCAPAMTATYTYAAAARFSWLSRDPIGEMGGLNLCQFSRNNPISRMDSLGLYTLVFWPWWSWSEQEINQVQQTFLSLYGSLNRAAAAIRERLALLDKQPKSCPFKVPLLRQYNAALASIEGMLAGLNSNDQTIHMGKLDDSNIGGRSTEGLGLWIIQLSNLGSAETALHELSHHYGTRDNVSDDPFLDDAAWFEDLALGVSILGYVENTAKKWFGTQGCCPMPSLFDNP